MHMSNGDLVIIPHGASHVIADSADTEPLPLQDVLDSVNYSGVGSLVYGGGGAGCCLVCGEFAFDDLGNHPLLKNLPARLGITGDTSYNTKWLDSALGFIAHEAAQLEPGANAIIDRLSEIILIQVIRATIDGADDDLPFLSVLTDQRMSRVLDAVHSDPANDWSVERLGKLVNMSRSSFSNRFTQLANMTPLQYVIFVRLQKASRLLVETRLSLLSIAEQIGYKSEAAFSEAFRKQFDQRPGEYRRANNRIAA